MQSDEMLATPFWRRSHYLDRMTLRDLAGAYFRHYAIVRYLLLTAATTALFVYRQAEPLLDRADLFARIAARAERFDGREVARPSFWGGYVMHPTLIEFWSDGAARLQEYRRRGDGWVARALFP